MNFNALGQALDCCKGSKDGTTSITSKILNEEQVEITYTSVIQYANDFTLRNQTDRERERAKSMMQEAVNKIKSEFKTLAGKSLKIKIVKESDNVEIIAANYYNPKKTAYYRFHLLTTVS